MIVSNSIKDAMKRNDRAAVKKIISDISENPEVIALRILSTDGEILISNNKAEIGSKSRGFVLLGYKASGTNSIMHGNSVTSYRVVRNERECFRCHDSRQEINGIIELTLDIMRQRNDIASVKRLLLFSSLLSIILVSALLSLLFNRNIVFPLRSLMETIKNVEQGDWDARVPVRSNDEIGEIGQSFNTMLGEMRTLYDKNLRKERELSRMKSELESKRMLEELNSQLNYKVKELETANKTVLTLSREIKAKNAELGKLVERLKRINEVGRILTSIIETDEIIKVIVKTSAEILFARKGAIHIDRENSPALTLSYRRGVGVEKINSLSVDFKDTYAHILVSGKPVSIRSDDVPESGIGSRERSMTIGVPLKMKGKIVGAMLLEDKMDGTTFTDDELELLSTLSSHAMVAIENAWLYEKLKYNYFSTIQSLVNALEASDPYTKGHSERVRYLSVELARYIGFDSREVEALEHAAILHDIGKIGIDSALLNKDGVLSKDELQIIRSHPVIGDEILGPIDTLSGVRTTILQHHEHYDGSGYPFGLIGEEISLKARILSVADTFDAMVSNRPYRGAMTVSNSMEELMKAAGTQLDPYVVVSFVTMMNEREKIILGEAGYGLAMALSV
jgi:HD-GYP domain-containing protein (c-di-GMP phosphodiesterase class II)